jgi:hypothetical protein
MPHGHSTRDGDCDLSIPDTDYETMERHGWGFVWARDDGAADGRGPFAACPEHRGDCDEREREEAKARGSRAHPRNADDRALELSVD